MLREALVHLSQEPRLRRIATRNPVARKMASRFVAGETLGEAIEAVRAINARGMTATLDHLGENVRSRQEAADATEAGCAIMRAVAEGDIRCTASFKLTQLGLDLGDEVAYENIRSIVEQAGKFDNFVRIDMEASEYIDRTLAIFYRLFEQHKNVGVVIQSYLYRSESDLEQLLKHRARVRLVKGAYLEPSRVAFQQKREVDANYVKLMKMLLSRGVYPAIATHDVGMIDATKQYAGSHGVEPARFEFQMLYGVRRDLQTRLRAQGYNMRIYVPYGTHWYPYLMRRMAERPANIMFVLGSIAREATANRRTTLPK